MTPNFMQKIEDADNAVRFIGGPWHGKTVTVPKEQDTVHALYDSGALLGIVTYYRHKVPAASQFAGPFVAEWFSPHEELCTAIVRALTLAGAAPELT